MGRKGTPFPISDLWFKAFPQPQVVTTVAVSGKILMLEDTEGHPLGKLGKQIHTLAHPKTPLEYTKMGLSTSSI